jgi:hypothetical protein
MLGDTRSVVRWGRARIRLWTVRGSVVVCAMGVGASAERACREPAAAGETAAPRSLARLTTDDSH